MNLRKVSDEVFIALDSIVKFGADEIELVKKHARQSARRRSRICAHKSNDDPLHEMLIAISAGSYIHPHRHVSKSESFHIIEGEVDVVVFDEAGKIVDVIELGAVGSGRRFYYRLSDSAFHTLLIGTDLLVMHEVTNGPFAKDQTILAPFAPTEDQAQKAQAYIAGVAERAAQYRSDRQK
jgi:cupin fold WbuC family metalloprotein